MRRAAGFVVLLATALAYGAPASTPRFRGLDAAGAALTEKAPTSDARACITDTRSGLTWELKTHDGGLHDRRWTYTPYDGNPATNGGYAGYRDATSGKCPRELMAGRSCNTEAYVEAVNGGGLCGYRDWRLPTYADLAAVASETSGLVATETPLALPDIEEGWYWTAVAKVGVTSFSRVVLLPPRARPQFYDGSYLVMVVRGPGR